MPVLSSLSQRLHQDPEWHEAYEHNLPQAQTIADTVPLIHVTRSLSRALSAGSYKIHPTSIDLGRAAIIQIEDHLDLPRSLYFYAGRAYRSFGGAALAFAPNIEAQHTGSATPFDVEGLWHGFLSSNLPIHDQETRIRYIRESLIPLANWREEFAKFLAAYFSSPMDYWSGRPNKIDPAGLYMHDNSWNAWVFEVRFQESQSILDAIAWCASEDVMADFQRKLLNMSPLNSASMEALEMFLQRALVPGGTPYFYEVIEEWVQGSLEL